MTNLSLSTEEHATLRHALGRHADHLRDLLGDARANGRMVAEGNFLDELKRVETIRDKLEAA